MPAPAFVRDIMDPEPATVAPTASLEEVVVELRRHEATGLPVVNDGGRCVGMITEADLVIADEEGDLHVPHYIELFGGLIFLESMKHFEERIKKATAATAKDVMTEDPTTIDVDATVREAARVIAKSHRNRLPVVEHGRLVGLVTRVDVLEALTHDDE